MDPHNAARYRASFTLDLGEASPDGPGRLGRHPVYPPVEEDHDGHGGEEGANGAVEDIARVTWQDALGATVISNHPATVELRVSTAMTILSSQSPKSSP